MRTRKQLAKVRKLDIERELERAKNALREERESGLVAVSDGFGGFVKVDPAHWKEELSKAYRALEKSRIDTLKKALDRTRRQDMNINDGTLYRRMEDLVFICESMEAALEMASDILTGKTCQREDAAKSLYGIVTNLRHVRRELNDMLDVVEEEPSETPEAAHHAWNTEMKPETIWKYDPKGSDEGLPTLFVRASGIAADDSVRFCQRIAERALMQAAALDGNAYMISNLGGGKKPAPTG